MSLTTVLNFPSITCNVVTELTPIIPVGASGGTAPLTFSISPNLPEGLNFNTSTGAITGNPPYISPIIFYTVTVTDALNVTSSKIFNLNIVTPIPLSSTLLLARKTVNTNFDVGSFTPVIGTGGYGNLTYSISPLLPTGLTISASTGAITGIPILSSDEITYSITIQDEARSGVTKLFKLTSLRSFLTATTSISLIESSTTSTISGTAPVTSEGGEGALIYSIAPSLPLGVSFNTSTGVVSGTPLIGLETRTFYVTIQDQVAQQSTSSFVMSILDPNALEVTSVITSKNLIKNVLSIPFTPVTAVNGHGAPKFSISPSLPTGLSLNEDTGEITGKPTIFSPPIDYTIRVLDVNSQDFFRSLILRVLNPVTLTAEVLIPEVVLYKDYTNANAFPVRGIGGYGTYSYSISPSLPAGLSYNNGVLTGITSSTYHQTHAVTVTDNSEQITTATFVLSAIEVPLMAETFEPSVILDQWHPMKLPIYPVLASYGLRPIHFTISPALPDGLILDSSNGAISGTPYQSLSTSTYTITVRDSVTTATASFNLKVTAVSPNTGTNWITPGGFLGTYTELVNTSTAVIFAESSATYSIISGELPAGLKLSSNGIIYGTPDAVIK